MYNVGKYCLKAFWEIRKLELNKSLIKEIQEEAKNNVRHKEDDNDDSEGCSSSEEEAEPPTSSKKAMLIIKETDVSPERKVP